MYFVSLILSTIVSFGLLMLIFLPLEWAYPAKRQPFWRPAWLTDFCFLLGQYLVWNGIVYGVLTYFEHALHAIVPSGFRAHVATQPWWMQACEVLVLSDLLVYWGHRLQHRFDILWRFHAVHHTAEHLDWLAAHREHPIDSIYTVGLINLPAYMLGFPISTLAGLVAFRAIWAIYIHANVRIPLGPAKWLIGSPELHHWHHDRSRHAGNYANLSPLMDILFGTYRCPDHEPERLGIVEPSPQTYLGQLVWPFRRRRRTAKEKDFV